MGLGDWLNGIRTVENGLVIGIRPYSLERDGELEIYAMHVAGEERNGGHRKLHAVYFEGDTFSIEAGDTINFKYKPGEWRKFGVSMHSSPPTIEGFSVTMQAYSTQPRQKFASVEEYQIVERLANRALRILEENS
jgi:hypothetical protein